MAPLPSWLDHISPCEKVYVYQAALVCSDCGKAIIEELEKEGQVDTGDSDDWPQGPHGDGGGEADSPQHCDLGPQCKNSIPVPGGVEIGCPLGNPLTSDGEKYAVESIVRDILAHDAHHRLVGRLWLKIYNYLKTHELIKIPVPKDRTPKLEVALGWLRKVDKTEPYGDVYTDLRYVYGSAISDAKITLWRLELTDNGGFTDLSVVHLPRQEYPARTIENMLDEAFAEDAWE